MGYPLVDFLWQHVLIECVPCSLIQVEEGPLVITGYHQVRGALDINKDCYELNRVDEKGNRLETIDGRAIEDVGALLNGQDGNNSRFTELDDIGFIGMPKYFDQQAHNRFKGYVDAKHLGFAIRKIGNLVDEGIIEVRNGHGSPSIGLRFGNVLCSKVSDLRTGLVNVNCTNLVPKAVAEKLWRGKHSGLRAYDVLTPSRA